MAGLQSNNAWHLIISYRPLSISAKDKYPLPFISYHLLSIIILPFD